MCGKAVDKCDLHRKSQGAAHHHHITGIRYGRADIAQQIQPHYRNGNAEPGCHRKPPLQKQADKGNQNDVHCGQKACFSGIGVDKSYLLQGGSGKQGKSAERASQPQLFIQPFGGILAPGSPLQYSCRRDQKQHCQQAAQGLKGKRADIVHAHALGNEGAAPDHGCGK